MTMPGICHLNSLSPRIFGGVQTKSDMVTALGGLRSRNPLYKQFKNIISAAITTLNSADTHQLSE